MKEVWKKKSIKFVIIIITVLAVAIVLGIFAQSSEKKREYDAYIEAAEKYLSELDYEQAIAEYRAALTIAPNDQMILDALEQAYLEMAQVQVESENYEEAIHILERGYEEIQQHALLVKKDEIEEQQVEKEAEEARIKEEEQKLAEERELERRLLLPIYELLMEKDFEGLQNYLHDVFFVNKSELYEVCNSRDRQKRYLRYEIEDKYNMAVDGSGHLYYGEWIDDKPNGKGIIFGERIFYVGDIIDGKANGKGTFVTWDPEYIFDGTFTDGCMDGEIKVRWLTKIAYLDNGYPYLTFLPRSFDNLNIDIQNMRIDVSDNVDTIIFKPYQVEMGNAHALTLAEAPQWLLDEIEECKTEKRPSVYVKDGFIYSLGDDKYVSYAENWEECGAWGSQYEENPPYFHCD